VSEGDDNDTGVVPEWVSEFPTGLSVTGTVREVVKISERKPERARYWLSHSRDRRSVMRAAGDIGWNSGDLARDEFDSWLTSLPDDVAEQVLAGRLEKFAMENSDDPAAVVEEVSKYLGRYNLDSPIYLVLYRLVQTSSGDAVLLKSLVGQVNNYVLREEMGELVTSLNVEMFDSPQLVGATQLSVDALTASAEMSSSVDWAATIGNERVRERAIAAALARVQDPELLESLEYSMLSSQARMRNLHPEGEGLPDH